MNLLKTFTAILTLSLSANFIFAQNFESIAEAHIISNNSEFSTNVITSADLMVTNRHSNAQSGLTHVYFNQLSGGIKIYNAIANVSLDQSGNIFHTGNRFVRHARTVDPNPTLTLNQAVQSAATSLNQTLVGPMSVLSQQNSGRRLARLSNSSIASSEILGELMYVNQNGILVLVWSVAYQSTSDSNWRNVMVNAADGSIVEEISWTIECNFGHADGEKCTGHKDHSNHNHTFKSLGTKKETNAKSTAASALINGDYFVSPLPEESPSHGPLATVNSPWNNNIDPAANPFIATPGQSWHNDGTTTHFTTRGNNVWAVEDQDADDIQANGFSPTSMLSPTGQQYNFMPNFTLAPQGYQDALITNLFYWNNLCHDILYPYGFNEECGNFQVTNASGFGIGNDAVQADAIDGSGVNNANFAVTPDGISGRMQMFEFTQPALPQVMNTTFSGSLSLVTDGIQEVYAGIPWTAANDGPLVLVIDNVGTSEACGVPAPGNIINGAAISGSVALLDRGSCNFTEKVENAEAAGAISVVVCNNVPGPPIPMGGAPVNPINIPAIMVSQADCNAIKAALPGVSVSYSQSPPVVNRTSDYDNGIIVHEYAHGWSSRLTGGAANNLCQSGNEQMGEGWSDYLAILFTMKPTDTGATPRPIGTYAFGQPTTGGGIRTFPYSTDFAVNPETYGILPTLNNFDANGNFIPHPVGSVWVNMLWDMTWDLIGVHGFGTNLYETNPANPGYGGQNVALALVTEGLKLQPCNPGFVDGRDAILAADQALFAGANTCLIWNAFATRGLGFSADQGSVASVLDGTEAFDMPPDAIIEKVVSSPMVTDGGSVTWDVTVDALGCMGGSAFTVTDAVDPSLIITSAVCPSPAVVTTAGNNITITHPGFGGNPGTITCNIITTVNTMTTLPTTQVFFDDVESGTNIFTVNDITNTGSDQWSIVNTASNSPTNAWFVENTLLTKTTALESAPIVLGANPQLRFFHQYDTEFTWDGGFIEVSTDGGATWTQLEGSTFCLNGYNTTISGMSPNTDIVGREAFSGDSGGFIQSVADLSAFANSTVNIRFLFGEDQFVNEVGWWVDDIEILDNGFVVIENMACVMSESGVDTVCSTASTCVEIVSCMPDVLGLTTTSQDASCATGFDGSATVTASGGTAPYTYLWSNGQVTATATNLIAGNYTVIVTDANGCENTASVVVGAGVEACVGLDIPTMGEWGLICLALCLLIFGIVVIREPEHALEA